MRRQWRSWRRWRQCHRSGSSSNERWPAAPGFALSAESAPAVLDVCRRLEGLPLAIELAAARTRMLTVDQIADRLDSRLRLLPERGTTGSGTHRTLEAALDWSYGMLGEASQHVFRCLGVFAGHFTLDAVETVVAGAVVRQPAVLTHLAELVEHSLVTVAGRSSRRRVRYRLLMPVREYALEKLQAAGDEARLRDSHLAYWLTTAEDRAPSLVGPDMGRAVAELDEDYDDLHAALEWASAANDAQSGLRMVLALNHCWEAKGTLTEARGWAEHFLAMPSDGDQGRLRIGVTRFLGWLAAEQGDLAAAREAHEASVAFLRSQPNDNGLGPELVKLGGIHIRAGDFAAANAVLNEAVELCRSSGEPRSVVDAQICLGACAMEQGRYDLAEEHYRSALATCRDMGNSRDAALVLNNLGNLYSGQGDFEAAVGLYAEALAKWRGMDHKPGIALTLNNLGLSEMIRGRYVQAARYLAECVEMERQLGRLPFLVMAQTNVADLDLRRDDLAASHRALVEVVRGSRDVTNTVLRVEALEVAGRFLVAAGRPVAATQVLACSSATRATANAPLHPAQSAPVTEAVAACRAGLSTRRFNAEWTAGLALTVDEALAMAEAEIDAADLVSLGDTLARGGPSADTSARRPGGLTAREWEVAALVTRGLTNDEMAHQLNVVPKTVEKHLTNIFAKLGFTRRAQVAVWAVANGLGEGERYLPDTGH